MMGLNLEKQLNELVNCFGVQMLHLSSKEDNETMYASLDQGLRQFLKLPHDIPNVYKVMEQYYEEKMLCIIKDSFEEYYMNFLLPKEYCVMQEKEFIQIGPYLKQTPDTILDMVMERNHIPVCLTNEIKEYYQSIPLLPDDGPLEEIVLTQMGYFFHDREGIWISRVKNYETTPKIGGKAQWEEEDRLSTAVIEERYRYEDLMLDAVRAGDTEKVFEISRKFHTLRMKPRSEDTLRDTKNKMVIWNTLLRKAAQDANVHPVYIDQISEGFAKQIENCGHVTELGELSRKMIQWYCLLVRNHSLQGHSQVVRDALNYIDFHFREPLSLTLIAEQVNISSGYLSAQFKKEMGRSMIDYINEKRIRESFVLLNTTELPIQEIAERVGIYDENYYARLFKKYQGQTAKQYRTMMRMKN